MSKKEPARSRTQKATASDVALLAGVSKWTVSRAFTPGASIQQNTREEVMKAAEALGYRPNMLARSLSQKKTHIIGVAIDEIRNPNMTLLVDEVTRQLQHRGYVALLLNIAEKESYSEVMALAYQFQVDGILFLATVLTPELIDIAREIHRIPLVQLGRNADDPDIQVVSVDGYQAGREMAALLLEQGGKRFGYMKGPDTPSNQLLRLDGYRDALQAAQHPLQVELVAGSYARDRAYLTLQHYLQTTLENEMIDALFCENDILAIGALQAIRESGRTMAVVGFDNIDDAAAPEWQLTTYDQHKARLIEEAVNRLTEGVVGDERNWRQGELIVRRSHQLNAS